MAFVLARVFLPTLSRADAGFGASSRQFPGLRKLALGYPLSAADAGFGASSRQFPGLRRLALGYPLSPADAGFGAVCGFIPRVACSYSYFSATIGSTFVARRAGM